MRYEWAFDEIMGTVTESDGTAFSVIPTTDDDIGCVMALDKIMCKQMNSMAQGGETEALEIEPMDRLFLEQRIGSRRKARKNWHSLKCSSNVDGSAAGIVICSHEILRNKRKRGTRPKRTKYLEIFWIAVCPGLQGKGCGQTLLTKCIEYAQNRDADLREVRRSASGCFVFCGFLLVLCDFVMSKCTLGATACACRKQASHQLLQEGLFRMHVLESCYGLLSLAGCVTVSACMCFEEPASPVDCACVCVRVCLGLQRLRWASV